MKLSGFPPGLNKTRGSGRTGCGTRATMEKKGIGKGNMQIIYKSFFPSSSDFYFAIMYHKACNRCNC